MFFSDVDFSLGAKRCQCISGKTYVVEKTPLGLLSVVSDAGFSFLAKKRQ